MSNAKTLLIAALLVAFVVACNVDRSTDSGYTSIPFAPQNSQASVNVVKIKAGSTQYYLTRPGDYIASFGNDSFIVRAGPLAAKFAANIMSIDTVGFGHWQSTGFLLNAIYGNRNTAGFSWETFYFGDAIDFAGLGNAFAVPAGGYGSGNTALDSLVVQTVYGSVTNPDSITFRVTTNTVPVGTYQAVTVRGANIASDPTGIAKFDNCTASPACVYTIDPTSVSLTNAVQYAKITWSNNGDVNDSTEVWFGVSGSETLQQVAAPGITLFFANWLSGSHIYQAKVRHRYNGVVGNFVFSNSLTR